MTTHAPHKNPPATATEGDTWPEILPCGGRVIWRFERGVWRYVTDTLQTPTERDAAQH